MIIKKNLTQKISIFVYLLFCVSGILVIFYPTIVSGFTFIQSDLGDTRLVNYFLEHSFQMLVNRNYLGELWSPAFFYPYKNILAFSENLFGSAPLYWLFRSFLDPDTAFQLWTLIVCILCFVSFAILMQRYQVSHATSALGAFLFAFNLPKAIQLTHPQLLLQFFIPLVFLILWDFVKQPTTKRLVLVLLLIYLQVLSGIYLGWFLLFSLLIFSCVTYGLYREARTKLISFCREAYITIIPIILGWVALMLLTLSPYLQAKAVLGARTYEEIDSMLPRMSSWFSVPPGSLWSPLLGGVSKDLPMVHEHYMFSGFIVLLLAGLSIYSLCFLKNRLTPEKVWIVKICLLVFIIIFCLSLRLPFGLSLWRIVYEVVPGASAIRVVTRIWTVAYFYVLVAGIICLDSALPILFPARRLRLTIFSLVCILGVAEQIVLNLPSYEKTSYTNSVVELRELMKKNCDVAYLSVNQSENPESTLYLEDHLLAMWAGIEANVPVVNGYSGSVPPNYGDHSKAMNTAQVSNWIESTGKSNAKRLCMIYHKSSETQDQMIATYDVQKQNGLSTHFKYHVVNLPISKVFSQDIKFFELSNKVKTSSILTLPVVVKNTSNFVWSNSGNYPTYFSSRWLTSDGKLAIFDGDGERTALPVALSPGESSALNAVIRTPSEPGRYKLILTMVQEYVAWFNDRATNSPEVEINVVSK
jgi:hypothetical protein